ncbi:hypothetical protein [Pseudomonas aeruginosa]|uniref:hypothetical protein n=1 Tax=Pseudomonas aeruginosa TaxID=287 RepID=UPI00157FA2F0|nr:hypothetical protein [Pseudomonas aeruginosa]EKW7234385.1 hypothetical protein [Pseudomonas aeruginosa]MBI8828351.1 hypothetical protein [Pseudomonas aeruginosa]QKR10913.1 hypothetical protein HB744_20745 [Pseudomonas aeruginosa]
MNKTNDDAGNIPADGKKEYVEAYSHSELAKKWGVSLSTLDSYAQEQGWDREHKLHWQDIAIEVLKKGVEEHNYVATKELLKAMGITRPVGRPPKAEIEKQKAIALKIDKEFEDDVKRMKLVAK